MHGESCVFGHGKYVGMKVNSWSLRVVVGALKGRVATVMSISLRCKMYHPPSLRRPEMHRRTFGLVTPLMGRLDEAYPQTHVLTWMNNKQTLYYLLMPLFKQEGKATRIKKDGYLRRCTKVRGRAQPSHAKQSKQYPIMGRPMRWHITRDMYVRMIMGTLMSAGSLLWCYLLLII